LLCFCKNLNERTKIYSSKGKRISYAIMGLD